MKLRTTTNSLLAVVFLVGCVSVNTEQKPLHLHQLQNSSKGRNLEEIRKTVQANADSIYAIYQRALRKNPNLRGKVVCRITIEPSGQVSSAKIISTEINEPEFQRELIQQLERLDFGTKEVDVMILTYPIQFLPS